MAISRSPSTTSLVTQSSKPVVGTIWGTIASIFNRDTRDTPRLDDTLIIEPEDSQHSHPSPQAHSYEPEPPSSYPAGPSQLLDMPTTIHQRPDTPPIFIARDFAYKPKPEILDRPVDMAWFVPIGLDKRSVPGLQERAARQWEESNRHLFRLEGNRADPPNTIPKTWGGLSKAEDDKLMRRAKEHVRRPPLALGLTPTEPNLGGPPPAQTRAESAHEIAAREAAYRAAKAKAADHGPLVTTPTNSPPGYRHGGIRSPPPHPRTPSPPPHQRTPSPSPRRAPLRRSKRKHNASESEAEETNETTVRPRKRRQVASAAHAPSAPTRYSLRKRQIDGTAAPSTQPPAKSKDQDQIKGKGPTR